MCLAFEHSAKICLVFSFVLEQEFFELVIFLLYNVAAVGSLWEKSNHMKNLILLMALIF